MRTKLLAALIFGALTVPTRADDIHTMLAKCAEKTADAERLACFDAIAKFSGAMKPLRDALQPKSAEAAAPAAEWQIEEKPDAIDDSPSVIAWQTTEDGGLFKPIVSARCVRGKTELLVKWQQFAIGADGETVTSRIGDDAPETKRWSASSDRQANFYPEWPGAFLRRAASASRLVFRKGAQTVEISTAGLPKVVEKLAAACKWPASATATR